LSENLCRNCGGKLRFIEGSKKWICDSCQISYSGIPPPPTTAAHLRYSTVHEGFTIAGLLLVLAAEGLSFLVGLVKGSTLLYLQSYEIQAYESVARTIEQLTASYQFLNYVVTMLELLVLGLVISSAATLHSVSRRQLHRIAVVGAPLLLVAHFIAAYQYGSLTEKALSELPKMVPYEQLRIASEVQQRFESTYGFWGGPAYTLINIFTWISVAALLGAVFTLRVPVIWQPLQQVPASLPTAVQDKLGGETPIAHPPVAISPVEPSPSTPTVVPATKFCRQCGAKILRDSNYCEECGTRLG